MAPVLTANTETGVHGSGSSMGLLHLQKWPLLDCLEAQVVPSDRPTPSEQGQRVWGLFSGAITGTTDLV